MPGPIYAVNPQDVFNGEKNRKSPLQSVKEPAIALSILGYGFQNNDQYTGENGDEQSYIKCFAGRSIGLEDDFMQFLAQLVLFHPDAELAS